MSDTGRGPIHFLHISKTGGTAVQHALSTTSDAQRSEFIFHPHQVTLRDVPEEQSVVFFLRDPVTRFASAFASRQRLGKPRYQDGKHTEAERIAFENFSSPNELARALSSTDEQLRARAEQAMRGINHVRIQYADWFHGHDYFLSRLDDVFFIGFQESLTDDFSALREKLGLAPSVRLPEDSVAAHRRPQEQNVGLDDQSIANIQAWFHADYEFVRLCQSVASTVNSK